MTYKNYPRNWKKASRTLRRAVGYRCEWCQQDFSAWAATGQPVRGLTVHHQGVRYANGAPGNPHDKHDLRRENLIVLCEPCHMRAEIAAVHTYQNRRKKASRKRQKRRLRGVALVPYGVYQ